MKAQIPRYRMIEVKFIGPTDTRGSRIKLTDLWREESVTLSYNHAYSHIEDQAHDYLTSKGFTIVADSADQVANTHFLMLDNFDKSIKTGAPC